ESTETMAAICLEQFNLTQARQHAEEACTNLRVHGNAERFARALGTLATVDYYWGDSEKALGAIREAILTMEGLEQLPLYGLLQTRYAAILCQIGQYRQPAQAFEKAMVVLSPLDDPLPVALHRLAYARESARETGQVALALEHLQVALPILQERGTPQVVIESLLAMSDCHLRLQNVDNAKK